MVTITNHQHYVKVDLTLEKNSEHAIVYIMKDKAFSVKLAKDLSVVEVYTADDIYELDVNGKKGARAKIENSIPLTNIDLAKALADLKNL